MNKITQFSFLSVMVIFSGAMVFVAHDALAQQAQQIITHSEERLDMRGSPDLFTGDVNVKMFFDKKDTAPYSAGLVTFQKGARSNWHTHPAGQHLIVVEGIGLTGTEDGKVVEIHQGDVVWCPPNIKHWHGARKDQAMTHITVTGEKDGNVTWLEPVTDAQYNAALSQ